MLCRLNIDTLLIKGGAVGQKLEVVRATVTEIFNTISYVAFGVGKDTFKM